MACATAARSCMQTSLRRESSLARSLGHKTTSKQASKPCSNNARWGVVVVVGVVVGCRRLSVVFFFLFFFFLREGTKTKRVWSEQEDEKVGKVGRQNETAKRDERRKGGGSGQVGRRKEVGRFSIMVFVFSGPTTTTTPRGGLCLFGVGGWMGATKPLIRPLFNSPLSHHLSVKTSKIFPCIYSEVPTLLYLQDFS